MNLILVFLATSIVMFSVSLFRLEKEKEKRVVNSRQLSFFFMWRTFDNWIDIIVYPHVLIFLGVEYGFAAMVLITFVINAVYLNLNNSSEEDWTFMSLFNRLWKNDSAVWFLPYARIIKTCWLWWARKFLCCLLNITRKTLRFKICGKSLVKPLGFLFFTIREDSFCAINFLYHKNANLRDKKVFGLYLLSHVICNLVWLPVALGLSWGIEMILKN